MSTVVRGLNDILKGGAEFITFEENKPKTLLFLDWYDDLSAIREHYEPALNPKYVRCPGKDVCPLCIANPGKYPALRIKFRVFDPTDNKVKLVSLAKSHIQKLNADFNLDEIDPTQKFVTIHRTGKGATDTSYSSREYKPNPEQGRPVLEVPNRDDLEIPDLTYQLTAHTPEEIQGFMDNLIASATGTQPQTQTTYQAPPANQVAPDAGATQAPAAQAPAPQRRLPF